MHNVSIKKIVWFQDSVKYGGVLHSLEEKKSNLINELIFNGIFFALFF